MFIIRLASPPNGFSGLHTDNRSVRKEVSFIHAAHQNLYKCLRATHAAKL